jgi:uncharacterized membrane protein YkvA (DUF1232 family)
VLDVVLGIAISLAATWLAFLVVLAVWRPKGIDLREAARLVPDVVRLLRRLVADGDVPPRAKRRLAFLLGYLSMPFDVVPDFIPVLGYADDVIVIAIVLRGVVRAAGADAIRARWDGTPAGLRVVERLAGVDP